jgi:alpha-beta hydrolase superfamily lysophospholipase
MRRAIAVLFLGVLALTVGAAWAAVPGVRHAEMPDRYGLEYKKVELTTSDQATVLGWWFPAGDHAGAVVLAPNATGTMADLLPVVGEFHARGFAVMTFDYRDFGPSGAGPQDSLRYVVRASRWVTDMLAAMEFARSKIDSTAPLFAWGQAGLSSVNALAVAARMRMHCEGVVMEGVYPDAEMEMRANGTWVIPEAVQQQGALMDQRDEPYAAAVISRAPVLLVGGERDTLLPVAETARLLSRRRGRLDRVTFPGVGHDHVSAAPGYFDRVCGWMKTMGQFVNAPAARTPRH